MQRCTHACSLDSLPGNAHDSTVRLAVRSEGEGRLCKAFLTLRIWAVLLRSTHLGLGHGLRHTQPLGTWGAVTPLGPQTAQDGMQAQGELC